MSIGEGGRRYVYRGGEAGGMSIGEGGRRYVYRGGRQEVCL